MAVAVEKLKGMTPPEGMDFHISKLGHIVLQVSDLERSTAFYTQVLGFKVSDVYPEEMMPGGMVFLRCNTDHHCLALVGAGDGKTRTVNCTISLSRSRPWPRSSMRATACARMARRSTSKAVGVPAARLPSSFATPTITHWKSTGVSIRSAATAASARQMSGTS